MNVLEKGGFQRAFHERNRKIVTFGHRPAWTDDKIGHEKHPSLKLNAKMQLLAPGFFRFFLPNLELIIREIDGSLQPIAKTLLFLFSLWNDHFSALFFKKIMPAICRNLAFLHPSRKSRKNWLLFWKKSCGLPLLESRSRVSASRFLA